MKVNCIIDTCSCIYLTKAEFRQKSLLRYLYDTTNINYCREVHLEILDHADKGLPTFIRNEKLKTNCLKHSIDQYEKKMLGKILPSRRKGGNKGEIDNFLVCIDHIHHLKKISPVFITDDQNALNGSLFGWVESFPTLKVWNSYDVILFLYAEKVIPSKDIAIELVRDIVSFIVNAATKALQGDEDEKEKRRQQIISKLTSTLGTYNRRIENISRILN